MSNSIQGFCGSVTEDAKITSNGNFSCTKDATGVYTIDYNGTCTNPIPVVTLTTIAAGLTCNVNAYSGGFKVYVFGYSGANVNSSFNFIVANMV